MAPKNSSNVETKQTSIVFPGRSIIQLERLQADGWGTVATVITVAVDRLYQRQMMGLQSYIPSPTAERDPDAIQKSIRLNRSTVDQIEALNASGFGTQTAIILLAIKQMDSQAEAELKWLHDEDQEPIAPGDYHYFNPRPAERPSDQEYAELLGL